MGKRGRAGKHKFWMLLLLSGSLTIFGACYIRIYNRTCSYIYIESACVVVVFLVLHLFLFFKKSANKYPSCMHTYILYITLYKRTAIFVHKAKQHSTTWHLEHMETGSLSLSFPLFSLFFVVLFNLRVCVCICVFCICEWLLLLNRYRNNICSCPTKMGKKGSTRAT